jgi:acyl-CoA thioesterase-2
VERTRDGRSFCARRVVATQGGEVMFTMEASFTSEAEGIAHQDAAPSAPGPEGLPDWDAVRRDRVVSEEERQRFPIAMRACHPEGVAEGARGQLVRQVWMRPRGVLPADPVVHAAVLLFASDRGMLGTVARKHGIEGHRMATASLDHAVWFHRPARFDDWLLFTTESPAAFAGRALTRGTFHDEAGNLVASVAQEGIVRSRERRAPGGSDGVNEARVR